jgi:transcriptional regulator with XRE-family HTH domain
MAENVHRVRAVERITRRRDPSMNEFQLTLMNYLARQGMSLSELAKRVGYDPLLFEKIVLGKTRQIPVNFFLRIADVLNLTTREKDILERAWAFGTDRWNWSQSYETLKRTPAKRKAG